ncbi:GlcNAc-PI de-N-acetylase [Rhizobiales bacterium GAS191]|jgi:LmbE family N-acetylglucosaminyl deacetylase|nr:GlcNAc-PI de-N-acetylase [Rhizobiales bacterium GAS113]SEE62566.1 GlcNAc-PI de-N-acetylase [Rhizobiales bacterium GAS191]
MSTLAPTLYLSPHCDDIAYSLAGRILAGEEATGQEIIGPGIVVTIFTQSDFAPYASHGLARLDTDAITQLRRTEETAFCHALNLESVPLPLAEAPLRGERTIDDVFVTDTTARLDPIISSVVSLLETLAEQRRPGRVYAPLGISGHIDHLVTRFAAESVFGAKRCSLLLYEDLPYAGELPADACRAELERLAVGLRPALTPAGDWLPAKLHLLSGYTSQVASKDLQAVISHTERIGGERVWCRG